MIWNSVIAMTVIDVLVVTMVAAMLVWLFRARHSFDRSVPKHELVFGPLIGAFGVALTGLFYLADLVAMHVLPLITAQDGAMQLMTYLHLEVRWLVSLVSIAAIAIGAYLTLEQLRTSESRYRTIVADQEEFIVRWLPDGTRTWVNEPYCRFRQQPREVLVGTSFFPLLRDADRERLQAELAALTPENASRTVEHQVLLPDGGRGWQKWTDCGTFDADGNLVELQSVGRDVTDRRLAEQALRDSEERYRGLVEGTTDWVWEIDLRGRHTYSNRQLESILGYSEAELSGLPLETLVHPEDLREVDTRLPSLIANGEGWQGWLLRFRHKDDHYRYLQSNATPVFDATGAVSGFRGIDRDATFQMLLAQISSDLMKAHPEEIDAKIEHALGLIGREFGADRASLWQYATEPFSYRRSHTWVCDGVESVPPTLPEMPWLSSLVVSGHTVKLNTLDDIPPQGRIDRAVLDGVDVKSLLAMPLLSDGQLLGCATLVTVQRTRQWSENIEREFRLFTELLANNSARRDAMEQLRQRERDLARSEQLARIGNYSFYPVAAATADAPTVGSAAFSEELVAILGLKPDDMSFDFWLSRVHAQDRENFAKAFSDALADQRSDYLLKYRLVRPDGSMVYVEDRGQVDRDAQGIALRVFGSVKDITQSVLRERELEKALAEVSKLKHQLEEENLYLREEIRLAHGFDEIVGESPGLKVALAAVEKVARTDATVLLLGETGTGKELIARAVHGLSDRRDKPLVSVNCAALSASLIESELFGHEKGAFTGAQRLRKGRFELADGGTLFLDEVADMPLDLQAKLLRVLQFGSFERLGGTATLQTNVRLIVATNRDLRRAVDQGEYRADLYYRINKFPISLPPLRERRGDITLLAAHFVSKHAARLGRDVQSISGRMMRHLKSRPWPGNVREFESFIERALISTTGPVLDFIDPEYAEPSPERLNGVTNDMGLLAAERAHILSVLESSDWVISGNHGAAASLGIPASTLRSKMKKLEIRRAG